jgi:LmbE family N-acetylglucosaminyl deacetylase
MFAGDPTSKAPPSSWDERCGFASAAESAATRRTEDARACTLVGVEPVWLPFDVRRPEGVADALRQVIAPAGVVLVPGFPCTHRDHILATRTVLSGRRAGVAVGLYVDQPYAMWRLLGREGTGRSRRANLADLLLRRPASTAARKPTLSEHLGDLVSNAPVWAPVSRTRRSWLAKQRATLAYTSQRRAFSPAMPLGIALYEALARGEGLAWV